MKQKNLVIFIMQILTRDQIRAWDEFTILNEPVSPLELMERAARACYDWITTNGFINRRFSFFCAKGNNGGDGLALARMLSQTGHAVKLFILEFGTKGTEEFQENLIRLHQTNVEIKFISTEETIAPVGKEDIIIDALLGSGLNRSIEGLTAKLIAHINQSGNEIISIDIPSGLYPDKSSKNNIVVHAGHTLSFQCYKLAFMMAENEIAFGIVHVLDIGLHPEFLSTIQPAYRVIDKELVKLMVKPRKKFSHKGDYGHVALIAGSTGMMGAAVMCAMAIIKTGAGKLTVHMPGSGCTIMQVAVPEAMCKIEDGDEFIKSIGDLKNYQAIAIGPGIGQHDSHRSLLAKVFRFEKPMVIDADGLNTIGENPDLLKELIPGSIITPHPGEFARLFGKSANDFENIKTALKNSAEWKIYIVLKGAYTFIATPEGKGYFNTTGNPGLAKGGSGDVLTGVIAGLLSQKFNAENAAIAGVYLHGLAGDFAEAQYSQYCITATDITNHLGDAFKFVLNN